MRPYSVRARRMIAVGATALVAGALVHAVGAGGSGVALTSVDTVSAQQEPAPPAPGVVVDEPRPGQEVAAGRPLRSGGTTGAVGDDALYTLAVQSDPAGRDLYTVGEAAVLDAGRWSGSVVPPPGRPDAPVSVVVVRADPFCGRQLATMSDPRQGSERFYGPLPPGCAVLATVPVRSR